jgi:hypothetical protein
MSILSPKNLISVFIVKKLIDIMSDNLVKSRMMSTGGNMGLQRSIMPQIAENKLSEYMRYMKANGVLFTEKIVKASELKLVQSEYNKDKVLSLMKAYKSGIDIKPILVSKDGFVLDGSHRFLAVYNNDPLNSQIKVLMSNNKISELLSISRKFAGVQFRSWTDVKIKPTKNN